MVSAVAQAPLVVDVTADSPPTSHLHTEVKFTSAGGTMSIVIWLIVGALGGWLAGVLVKGGGFGLIGDIVVGIIGAVIGGWLAGVLGISIGSGFIASVITAVIGAVILLVILRLIKRA
jgi:uncharacterized membrane protein YeaQ/YmgE (transglycosylase-associated protein family)